MTPLWVDDLFCHRPAQLVFRDSLATGWARQEGEFSHILVTLPGIEAMDIFTVQHSVAKAYRAVFQQVSRTQSFAVRFWASIPGIHADHGNGLDRYMGFNAGRFAAYVDQLGGPERFPDSMPTASAVGSRGEVLVIECLAWRWAGRPVENPRQTPAYRYSNRFGPLPPCFSRATLLHREGERQQLLLVGGTASIRGEDSRHPGELVPQALETFRNLGSIVRSACLGASCAPADFDECALDDWLQLFRELRVYHREIGHRGAIVEMVRERFRRLSRLEVISAELCRSELLVEIEGVASLAVCS